jgi:ribosomal-protein-alanine N-acetyltransferase
MAFLSFVTRRDPVLEGKRILLRTPRYDDYESWRSAREGSGDFLKIWEPTWGRNEFTRSAWHDRLSHYRSEARAGTSHTFFVVRHGSGDVAGGVTVGKIVRGVSQSCELGYWMAKKHAGQGLMSEALGALVPHVFGELGLHRIEAACIPENMPSRRLLEKAGFLHEGRLRGYLKINGRWQDHDLFALLRDDTVQDHS